MDRLWSPWRLAYVTGGTKPDGCIFCAAGSTDPSPDDRLVLARGRAVFVILNRFPYNNGHLMVVPRRHVAMLSDTTAEERTEITEFTVRAEVALSEAYGPEGLNVGINLGKAAGAGIAGHLHVHVVPRWSGDTNFMTAVAETRVLPEELEATASRLRPIFQRLSESR
jgi:ATP adenylyltransferase